MASTSETGHAKNVANFNTLISFCNGYGAVYNPTKTAIQIPALTTLYGAAQASLNNLTSAGTQFITATNARQLVFDPVKPLSTRIVNALDATDASDELVNDAKTINRKIQGSRKSTKQVPPTPPDAPPATDDTISVSQQSYDSVLENFKKLIDIVAAEPSYSPNEVDLRVDTLSTVATTMETNNSAVVNAATELSNRRIDRNQQLYGVSTGVCDIALEVKKYIKSVFGASSPQYKQVSGIKFTKSVK